MSDKEISEKTNSIQDREILTDKEISIRLERINTIYSNLTKNSHKETKSPSSSLSEINTISPITKAESIPLTRTSMGQQDKQSIQPFEPNQFLSRKRKFKKINKSKRELAINAINCPQNFNIVYNYSYLMKDFRGESDNYSSFNTQNQNEMCNRLFEHNNNNSKDISFGDSPCKLYSDYLVEGKTIKANAINTSVMHLPMFSNENQFEIPAYYLPNAFNGNQKERKRKIKASQKDHESMNAKDMDIINIESSSDDDDDKTNNNNDSLKIQKIYQSGEKKYSCSLCPCLFVSPQGLGGHMSRTHKDQSIKFQNKKQIRLLREPQRKLLEKAKILLCEKFNENYYQLLKTKRGKDIIKNLVLSWKKEYKEIRKKLREEAVLNKS